MITSERMTRRDRILNELESNTVSYIQNADPSIQCGLSAEQISDLLLLDRANTSRILNELYNSGLLIKTLGKPTYYLHKTVLTHLYPNLYIPSTLPKDHSILRYINSPATIEETTGTIRNYDNVTKIGIERSLSKPFKIACSAMAYPPHGLHTLVVGSAGTGRRGFVRELHHYAIENGFFPEDAPLIFCDCREYRNAEPDLLTALFGEGKMDNRRARKGLLEMASGGILVLQGTQTIDTETLRRISALLVNQTYSRIGEAGYPRACNCIIVCLANKENIKENENLVSFYNSFPVQVNIPDLHERDIVEILDYVLYFFKRETSNINLAITVSKEVIYYLMANDNTINVTNLANAIKASCASAYQKRLLVHSSDNVLNVVKDDLPDRIVSQVRDDKDYVESVRNALDSINESEFHFIPKTPLSIK